MLVEVEVGVSYPSVPENLGQRRRAARRARESMTARWKPEDLGETDHVVEITVGDQSSALGAQGLSMTQILQKSRTAVYPAGWSSREARKRSRISVSACR